MADKRVWYKKWWGVLIVIFLILPFFLIWQVWTKTKWSNFVKIVITLGIVGFCVMILVSESSHSFNSTTAFPTTTGLSVQGQQAKKDEAEAIKKAKASADQDILNRIGALTSFTDVYKNPKGDGLIVWMSSTEYPDGGFIYLVVNGSIYAISGDASYLSPSIPKAENISYEDLKDIGKMRETDYKNLLDACLKDAEFLKENGVVEKRVNEKKSECNINYSK